MVMVRREATDDSEQKVLDDIARFGWHCVNILPEGEAVRYSFTVGLFHSYRHPELIIYGLKPQIAHGILCRAVEGLPDRRLDLSRPTDDLAEGYPCAFVEVPESRYYETVGFARWYYLGNDFPLYQIVWPSRVGLFPWDPHAPAEFKAAQPVLGRPPT